MRGPDAQHRARRHSALGAARAVGDPASMPSRRARARRAPASPRRVGVSEPVADLDALDGLDAHEGLRRAARRGAGPSAHASRARAAGRRRAPRRLRRACRRPCGRRRPRRPCAARRGVEAAQRVGIERRHVAGRGQGGAVGTRTGADRRAWLSDAMPEPGEERLATAPSATRAAVSRALARSRTGRASSKSYFCIPARSAWPGRGRVSGVLRGLLGRIGGSTGSAAHDLGHFGHSVLPIRSAIGLPSVCPWRTPPRSQLVCFELHARATAIAKLASGEVGLDRGARDGDAGRQALHDGDEFGAVRFAGREHAEHSSSLPRSPRASRRARPPRHRSGTSGSPAAKIRTCSRAWCSSIPSPGGAADLLAPTRSERVGQWPYTTSSSEAAVLRERVGCGIRHRGVAGQRRDRTGTGSQRVASRPTVDDRDAERRAESRSGATAGPARGDVDPLRPSSPSATSADVAVAPAPMMRRAPDRRPPLARGLGRCRRRRC